MVDVDDRSFVAADIPGIIEGAHEGAGLGLRFLRHVERCAAIVHVVDMATMEPGRNPLADLEVIENELKRYGGLDDRPRPILLTSAVPGEGKSTTALEAIQAALHA